MKNLRSLTNFNGLVMKGIRVGFFLLAISSTPLLAQHPEAMKKIEAARIGVITERLELTPEQAEQFWPIYRELTNRRREIRSEMRQLRHGHDPATATEEENRKLLDENFQLQEKELVLNKEYDEKLLTVISPGQLLALKQAEEDFRRMILRQLERRAQKRGNR